MHIRWLVFLSFLLIGLISANEEIVKSARVIEPFNRDVPWEIDFGNQPTIDVNLILKHELAMVEVRANQAGPFLFLLDTGADISIISDKLINQLNLKAIEKKTRKLVTAHGQTEMESALYLISELKLGGATLRGVPLLASNTAQEGFKFLEEMNIVGVLGINLFHDIILKLDLPNGKLRLIQDIESKANSKQKGEDRVKLEKGYYLPVIKSKIIKNKQFTEYLFLIDSGYTGFIKMPVCFERDERPLVKAVLSKDAFHEVQTGFISELDGDFLIGNKKLEHPLVRYDLGNCKVEPRFGLIGMRFLRYHALSIDQKNREIVLY